MKEEAMGHLVSCLYDDIIIIVHFLSHDHTLALTNNQVYMTS